MQLKGLDYGAAVSDPKAGGQTILNEFQGSGFLYVENIPGYDPDELLRHTKWFYDLDEKERLHLKPAPYRGYMPTVPGKVSFKELFEIGLFEKGDTKNGNFILCDGNQWPLLRGDGEQAARFKAFVQCHFTLMYEVAKNLLSMLAEAAGVNPAEWISLFEPTTLSTMRLLRYPPRHPDDMPPEAKVDNYHLHCEAHSDTGFLTLLSTFNFGGLQIQDLTGKWHDVETGRDGLVINIGDMMLHLCPGLNLKATTHRVVDLGKERLSAPFFLEPRWDAPMGGSCYGKLLLEKMKDYGEYINLLKMIE